MPPNWNPKRTGAAGTSDRRRGDIDEARRLHGIDHSFVAYERRRGGSMGIGLLARFDGVGPDESRLREHLADRFAAMPELRWVLRDRAGGLAWCRDPRFAWDERILAYPGRHLGLRAAVADIVSEPLDLVVAPWRMWLLRGFAPGQWALLFHVHHALADGLSMMSLAQRALGTRPTSPWPPRSWLAAAPSSWLRAWATLVRDAPRQLWNLVPRRSPEPRVTTAHTIDWTGIDTAAARRLGGRHGATVNDVLLATFARGLPPAARRIALIPVGIRTVPGRLGNEVAMFRVRLPADRGDPLELLRASITATTRAKHGPDVAVAIAGLRVLPQSVQNRILDRALAGTNASLIISNWGTAEPLAFQGEPVQELVPIMFRPSGHAVTIGFATHADRTHIGFVAAGDPGPLRHATGTAFAELCDLDP